MYDANKDHPRALISAQRRPSSLGRSFREACNETADEMSHEEKSRLNPTYLFMRVHDFPQEPGGARENLQDLQDSRALAKFDRRLVGCCDIQVEIQHEVRKPLREQAPPLAPVDTPTGSRADIG